jgi:hypothetical protein
MTQHELLASRAELGFLLIKIKIPAELARYPIEPDQASWLVIQSVGPLRHLDAGY